MRPSDADQNRISKPDFDRIRWALLVLACYVVGFRIGHVIWPLTFLAGYMAYLRYTACHMVVNVLSLFYGSYFYLAFYMVITYLAC